MIFRVDGAKTPEFPQKEQVLGSDIAARDRKSLAIHHCTFKLQWNIACLVSKIASDFETRPHWHRNRIIVWCGIFVLHPLCETCPLRNLDNETHIAIVSASYRTEIYPEPRNEKTKTNRKKKSFYCFCSPIFLPSLPICIQFSAFILFCSDRNKKSFLMSFSSEAWDQCVKSVSGPGLV